jgi:hypothetical protein
VFSAELPIASAAVDAFSDVSAVQRDMVVDQTVHDKFRSYRDTFSMENHRRRNING